MYTDRKTAPLGWMKFYKYVFLPLGIVSYFYDLCEIKIYDVQNLFIILGTGVVPFVLSIVCLVGLVNWKRYGLICVYIRQWINVLINLCILCYSGYNIQLLAKFTPAAIVSILWTIYFHHRSPLFSPDYKDPESKPAIPALESAPTTEAPPETPQYKRLYCPGCGTKLLPDAVFCHNCGRKL